MKGLLRSLAACLVLVQGVALGDAPRAELVSADGKLREGFDGRANSSGAELIGIGLGAGVPLRNPADIQIAVPRPGTATPVCIRVTTRDGLFWSDNLFEIPPQASGSINAGPVADEHLAALRGYESTHRLVRAAIPAARNCSTEKNMEVYVPALGNDDAVLNVYLNTKGVSTIARLLTGKGDISGVSAVRCESFDTGVAVATDRVCIFDLSGRSPRGLHKVHIRSLPYTGDPVDKHFDVWLPGDR